MLENGKYEDQERDVRTVYRMISEKLGNDRGGVLLDLIEILQTEFTVFD
jgi:hypothetical protein